MALTETSTLTIDGPAYFHFTVEDGHVKISVPDSEYGSRDFYLTEEDARGFASVLNRYADIVESKRSDRGY